MIAKFNSVASDDWTPDTPLQTFRRRFSKSWRVSCLGLLSIVTFIFVWYTAVVKSKTESIPLPQTVANALVKVLSSEQLSPDIRGSLKRVMVGFAIAASFGILSGVLAGGSW